MPGTDGPAQADEGKALPPPPSFGRQMAQLVIIPAVIVIACLAMWMLFVGMAGGDEGVDALLAKLRQSGGAGTIGYDIKDPRYQERSRAAYTLPAAIERELKDADPQREAQISEALTEILDKHVAPHEDALRRYLLIALGRLGQPEALPRIIAHLDADEDQVRYGAIEALSLWPDEDAARAAVPGLIKALGASNPQVRIGAAAVLGSIATPGSSGAIDALRQAMNDGSDTPPAVRQQAAIALAQLGDERGGTFVAAVLLDRQAVAEHVATQLPDGASEAQRRARTDELLLASLASVIRPTRAMTQDVVWDKIQFLADDDPNLNIRGAAKKLLEQRDRLVQPATDGR